MTVTTLILKKMRAESAATAFRMARLRTEYADSDELRSSLGTLAYNATIAKIDFNNACIETCPVFGGSGLEE